jgi:hypothetical protein
MGFPDVGDIVGSFTVREVEVGHEGIGSGRYEYPIVMVVQGKGGQQGVRQAFREFFKARRTLFSGYGNPYQCRFDRMELESLGDGRYRIVGNGIGVRIFLAAELLRFLKFLENAGILAEGESGGLPQDLVTNYLKKYQSQARRKPTRISTDRRG